MQKLLGSDLKKCQAKVWGRIYSPLKKLFIFLFPNACISRNFYLDLAYWIYALNFQKNPN